MSCWDGRLIEQLPLNVCHARKSNRLETPFALPGNYYHIVIPCYRPHLIDVFLIHRTLDIDCPLTIQDVDYHRYNLFRKVV